jgi:hypothetical protein
MIKLPLQSIPSQKIQSLLGGQYCRIDVYQKTTGLFLDLYVNNVAIGAAILCRDRVKLIREAYLGFMGDLTFVDAQGLSDPDYTGLGGRFVLVYLEAADL